MRKKVLLLLTCFALFVLSFGLVACGEQTYGVMVDLNIQNGIVSVSTQEAKEGTSVWVQVKPNDGYLVDEVTYNQHPITVDENGFGKFVMPRENVMVSATFKSAGDVLDGLFTCTSVSSDLPETYYKNDFLYFKDGKLDIGLVSDVEYFIGTDYDYSMDGYKIVADLLGDDVYVDHEERVLKNGNIEVEMKFTDMESVVYTFEKFSGQETRLQVGKYSAELGPEHFDTVLEENQNIFIVDSREEEGRDLGEAIFYGDIFIISRYDMNEKVVGRLTQNQDNSYDFDAHTYTYSQGYDVYVTETPMKLERTGDYVETEEKVYTIKSISDDEVLDETAKLAFVALKNGYAAIGIYISEEFYRGYYFRQYVPYTTADGQINLTLYFDNGEQIVEKLYTATVDESQLSFVYDDVTYVFESDSNSIMVESGVNYKLDGYTDPSARELQDNKYNRQWYFKYDSHERSINLFHYGDAEDIIYGSYGYNRVKVFADRFVCFNATLGNVVVGTISNAEGAIQLHGYEFQVTEDRVEEFEFTWKLTV